MQRVKAINEDKIGIARKKFTKVMNRIAEITELPNAEIGNGVPPSIYLKVEKPDLLNLAYKVIPIVEAAVTPAAKSTLSA